MAFASSGPKSEAATEDGRDGSWDECVDTDLAFAEFLVLPTDWQWQWAPAWQDLFDAATAPPAAALA